MSLLSACRIDTTGVVHFVVYEAMSLLLFCRIDFFSLDVEGAELAVLRTLNYTAMQIGVMCVEADGRDPTKDQRMPLSAKIALCFSYPYACVHTEQIFSLPQLLPLLATNDKT